MNNNWEKTLRDYENRELSDKECNNEIRKILGEITASHAWLDLVQRQEQKKTKFDIQQHSGDFCENYKGY